MTKKLLPSALLVLLSLSTASAATNTKLVQVEEVVLDGYAYQEVISPQVRTELVQFLNSRTGSFELETFPEELEITRRGLEAILNQHSPGVFLVSTPDQKLTDHKLRFSLDLVPGEVIYNQTNPYFSVDNIRRSLPSLEAKNLKFSSGKPIVDEREIDMIRENSFKYPSIEYQLEVGKRPTVYVDLLSPRGKHLFYFTLDNFSPFKTHYNLKEAVGYINGNLTGHDDVLSTMFLFNHKSLKESTGVALQYAIPFYNIHSKLTLNYVWSSARISNIAGTDISVSTAGHVGQLQYDYYVPRFSSQLKQSIKVFTGISFRLLDSAVSAESSPVPAHASRVLTTPVFVGLQYSMNPVTTYSLEAELKYTAYQAGVLGNSSLEDLQAAGARLVTAEKFQQKLTGTVSGTYLADNGFSISNQVNWQWSPSKTLAFDRFANSIRGFREGGVGDSGLLVKNTVTSPNLLKVTNFSFQPYAFVDFSFSKFNSSDEDVANNPSINYGTNEANPILTKSIASAGLGLKAAYRDISLDVFVSHKLSGKDNEYGNTLGFFTLNARY